MHNMNITKAMITAKSTFPVYIFSSLSCTANEHIQYVFVYLFIYFLIIVEVLWVLFGGNIVHVWHIWELLV